MSPDIHSHHFTCKLSLYILGTAADPITSLHRHIVEHGGGFLQYLDSKTMATHIIASTLPPKKTVDFSRYRIVKPAWITDSIEAGKLLPWGDYRVLDEGPRQKVLKFDGSKGLTQTSPVVKKGYSEQIDNSFYTSQLKSAGPESQRWSQVVQQAGGSSAAPDGIISQASPAVKKNQESRTDSEAVAKNDTPDYRNAANAPQAPGKSVAEMTPEEHNAWVLSDPKLREASCQNPNFLQKFYAESRLHHLSTWKAELKSSMQKLAVEKGLSERKSKAKPGSRKYIMHVDFDSFFCAVSLKSYPDFVTLPTVVAHGSGSSSEIASCNYPAREFGIKNGMWMKRAMEMCPDLKVIPYDFPAYENASRLFYEAIMEVGGVVQSVSIDEALIDATDVVLNGLGSQGTTIDESSIRSEQETAEDLALNLRKKIKEKTGCEVSVGIGSNILHAKVALRCAKPAGQYLMKPEKVLDVIGELKVDQLPGVSYNLRSKLEEANITLVKHIRETTKEKLVALLGPKTGEKLMDYARGIDHAEVGPQPPRKSVSAEVSWGIRFIHQAEAEEFLVNLCRELEKRLLNEQVKGTNLTVKIMRRALDAPLDPAKHLGHGKCDTFNKSVTFGVATNNYEIIGKEAVSVLRSFRFNVGDLRGLGVQMTKLEQIKAGTLKSEGSQKRLNFGSVAGPFEPRRARQEDIDDIESPTKPKGPDRIYPENDPIADDPLTPRKAKVHPAMALARAGEKDKKANSPLNISGTQFIIPSNVDPTVLAELPNDIRSKLMGQRPKSATPRSESPLTRSRPESPAPPEALPSQVDPDVFNALPDDMKAEVLASYGRRPQSHLYAQSPIRPRPAAPKKPPSPSKRGGIRGLFGKTQRQDDARAGVVQTSFASAAFNNDISMEEEIEEIDPEFLAELPEDVRKEVIADHRRRQLAQRSGLSAPPIRPTENNESRVVGQQRIEFPAAPSKVTFASSGISSTQEVKDMLEAWHDETKDDGPHKGDVDVFEKYLVRVVEEERDMDKASNLVKWLNVIVDQATANMGKEAWRASLRSIRNALKNAMKQRGLGALNL